MRRRPPAVVKGDPPAELRRYRAADWGSGPDSPVLWYAALDAWHEEHGESVAVDPDCDWPDVPFDPKAI